MGGGGGAGDTTYSSPSQWIAPGDGFETYSEFVESIRVELESSEI